MHPLLTELLKPVVIDVSTVQDQDGPRFIRPLPGHRQFVLLAFRNHGIARQMAIVIQQQMQFHRALGAAEPSPIEGLGTQINHRSIHTQQLVLETELALAPWDEWRLRFGIAPALAGTLPGTTARGDVRWHRPGWSAPALAANPKCRSLPSLAASPPTTSRKDLLPPN